MYTGKEEKAFISVDLGTDNILAYVAGYGVIYDEPSILAYDSVNNKMIAMGNAAYELIGKTHSNIRLVKPLANGVITDIDVTKDLLINVFNKLKLINVWKDSIVLLACPSGVTEIERYALQDVARSMGAKHVFVEEEIKMAALGAGLNIDLPEGHLVMDIGGGTTDVAIIASGDIIISRSVKMAGNYFDDELRKYFRSEYNVAVGERSAEQIKKEMGSLAKTSNEHVSQVYGRDIVSGLPKEIRVSSEEVRSVLLSAFSRVTDLVIEVLEKTPPELAGDVIRNGMIICGGGALIRNITKYFSDIFKIPVKIAENPLTTVIDGTKIWEKTLKKRLESGYYPTTKQKSYF